MSGGAFGSNWKGTVNSTQYDSIQIHQTSSNSMNGAPIQQMAQVQFNELLINKIEKCYMDQVLIQKMASYSTNKGPIEKIALQDEIPIKKITSIIRQEMRIWFVDYDLNEGNDQWRSKSDKIISLQIFKTPLSELQWTDWIFHHQYLVVQSNRWYSFEKTTEQIFVQASNSKDTVVNYRNGRKRCHDEYWKPFSLKKLQGKTSLQFYNLHRRATSEQQKNKGYMLIGKNCKNYAQTIFNEFTVKKINN